MAKTGEILSIITGACYDQRRPQLCVELDVIVIVVGLKFEFESFEPARTSAFDIAYAKRWGARFEGAPGLHNVWASGAHAATGSQNAS